MSNERDDFWDIDKLVPKKKKTVSPFVTKSVVKEITIPGRNSENCGNTEIKSDGALGFARDMAHEAESVSYTREDSLIKRVTVTRFTDKYDFYSNFRKAALLYYDIKAPQCDFEPFFSYMPQYSQLNTAQKSYYLYWREEMRRGRYIKSDYSYIYLYAYEILNLPDKIPPAEGLKSLISVWREYRREYPNIDSQLSLWVQDYCLLYNLPVPLDEISGFLFEAIAVSGFKEFYLSKPEFLTRETTEALLMYLSYYDWHRGKYAGGESGEIYKRHLLGAMYLFFRELWQNGKFGTGVTGTTVLSRPAFRGSLCTQAVKASLEIEYYPITHDDALRNTVTEALRYTENRLRALFGVKSRLAVKDLGDEHRRVIDFYFSSLFEKLKTEKKRVERPEYEKLYESESVKISLESADEIEKLSWKNTEMLVSEEELFEQSQKNHTASQLTEQYDNITAQSEDSYGLSADDIEFTEAVLNGRTGKIKEICERTNELAEGIADRINSVFADNFGDVIIEFSSDAPQIIDDYREEVAKWILKQTK